jgi:hypothetical protein
VNVALRVAKVVLAHSWSAGRRVVPALECNTKAALAHTGPLLWHFADMSQPSMELSLDEVMEVVRKVGFVVEVCALPWILRWHPHTHTHTPVIVLVALHVFSINQGVFPFSRRSLTTTSRCTFMYGSISGYEGYTL